MGTLSLTDAIKTLECPSCKQYITSDSNICRFCSAPITREMIESGVEKEDEVIRKTQINFYWGALITGMLCLVGGGILVLQFVISFYLTGGGRFFFWGPTLLLLGLGEVIYALSGFYKERPKKKNS